MSFNLKLMNLLKTVPHFVDEAIKNFEEPSKGQAGPAAGARQGLEKQKRLLAELLCRNQLYANLSEIDDMQFRVSQAAQALNKAFHGGAVV